ncbi:MAG: hypothetical protein KDC34_19050 [Saprospiraceae bacterium]|nr:hypothetical protein [Saprospiraceae bacterium]
MMKIDGKEVFQGSVHIQKPRTETGTFLVQGNGVVFQNVGTSTVVLNRWWTIPPRGSIQFGFSSSLVSMISQEFHVSFSGPGTNRLEIAVMRIANNKLSHYIEKDV